MCVVINVGDGNGGGIVGGGASVVVVGGGVSVAGSGGCRLKRDGGKVAGVKISVLANTHICCLN